MKRLAALLTVLLLLPQMAPAAAVPGLDGLDATQLEALRAEADARLRLLQLPDANGYLDVLDGEAYAREPQKHLNEKIRMDGILLSAEETDGGISYFLSLDSKPERVFLVQYTLSPDERLPLPGDAVSAYGVFEGLSPFTGQDELASGAPRLRADLVIPRLPTPVKQAAGGH
ncbi:MAG TPA: hypothetical protein PLR12_02400, partial [Clostridia bacterium]|nr:hypothetical protein [Clostridia bacterium]